MHQKVHCQGFKKISLCIVLLDPILSPEFYIPRREIMYGLVQQFQSTNLSSHFAPLWLKNPKTPDFHFQITKLSSEILLMILKKVITTLEDYLRFNSSN